MSSVAPTAGWVDEYLARIGVTRPVSADLQALRDLQAAHLLAARVFGAGEQPGPPFDHMTLRVDLAEPWLADVGFGRFATQPLRLGFPGEQPDPSGTFRVAGSPSGHGDLYIFHDGEPAYRVDPRPYALHDFAPACWWQQTFPDRTSGNP